MNYLINVVSSCQATELMQVEVTWEEFRESFAKTDPRGKLGLAEYQCASDKKRKEDKDGSGWIPCSLIDIKGARTKPNMDRMYFLVLDIDTGMTLVDVKSRIIGYEAIIHSSYSHSLEKPKWRVVFPLKEAIPANSVSVVFDHFQESFDGLLDAQCGHDSARLYYTPACPHDAEHLYHYEHLVGEYLDANEILKKHHSSTAIVPAKSAIPKLGKASLSEGVVEGGRNSTAFKMAAKLFNEGFNLEQVTENVLAWNDSNIPPLDEAEVRSTVKSAMKTTSRKAAEMLDGVDEIVDEMNTKYAYVRKQNAIYRFPCEDFVKIEHLRLKYANTGTMVIVGGKQKYLTDAEIWICSDRRRGHIDVDFIPGAPEIIDNKINFWRGWGANPVAGDVTPWVEFLDHMFSGDPAARKWIEQWIAYPIQHPGAKLTTAVVLWSIIQGVGKSMLGDTVGRLYGSHFKTISANELHASFNGWIRDCQFILGEENSSSDQRADSNKLKGLITGETVIINEKFQPMLEMANRVNFMFTSNHPDAFHLERADRRYFVWEIIAERKPNEYFTAFINWRDNLGGMNALMHHLQNLDLTGFIPKGDALMTGSKLEMIHQSKSEVERWLSETLEDEAVVQELFKSQISTLDEVTATFNRIHHSRVTTTAVSRAIRRGYPSTSRKISTRLGRKMLMTLLNHEKWKLLGNPAWQYEYERALRRM
jgi:hypothetical protein